MKKLTIAAMLGIALAVSMPAQDAKDPIDRNLDACLNSPAGSSTAGQSDCASKAYAAWDAELNKAYQKLLKTSIQPRASCYAHRSVSGWLFSRPKRSFRPDPGRASRARSAESPLPWPT